MPAPFANDAARLFAAFRPQSAQPQPPSTATRYGRLLAQALADKILPTLAAKPTGAIKATQPHAHF
jgi:hypothetical protein